MRAWIAVGVSVIMVACLACAENQSLAQMFTGDENITPPIIGDELAPLPEQPAAPADYKEDTQAGSEVTLAAAADLDALNTLILDILDVSTGERITDAHIRLLLDDGVNTIDTLRFVGDEGTVELQLHPATWWITLRLDITSTVGKDYYTKFNVMLTSNKTSSALLQPVGSLIGGVYDSKNNLLPGAEVKFQCAGDYGLTDSVRTDQFGSFSADWLPVGSCKVSALYGNKVGTQTVQIAQGQLSEARIILEQSVVATGGDYMWLIGVLVAVAAFMAFMVLSKKKKKIVVKEESQPIVADRHMEDILSALEENERRIVEVLMARGGKSMQNKLGRDLNLPKSSLSRAVSGLEARNIVKTEKLGRIKRVELSEWFLNRKKP